MIRATVVTTRMGFSGAGWGLSSPHPLATFDGQVRIAATQHPWYRATRSSPAEGGDIELDGLPLLPAELDSDDCRQLAEAFRTLLDQCERLRQSVLEAIDAELLARRREQ